jgi:single-strand DNA-binding protein
MASFNKVILMGNLTRDPELRYTPKGTAVAKFGLAVNRVWRTETGETKEEVTFVDVDVFGRTAENVSQYMRKGSPIFIEGRLRLDTWEDKQTQQKRSKLGVVADVVQFLGGSRQGESGAVESPNASAAPQSRPRPAAPARPQPPQPAEPAPAPAHDEPPPPEEDDVPF